MTSASELEELPDELLVPIMVEMPAEDLEGLCRVSRKLHEICQDQGLWREKFFRDFGGEGFEPFYPFRKESEVKDWRKAYFDVYNKKSFIPFRLQKLLREYGWKTSYVRNNIEFNVVDISLPDLYLLGIFLLPFTLAQRYFKAYLRERGFTEASCGFVDEWILESIVEIPRYLSDIYKWLQDPQDNTINPVPTGTNYGFRQALILLAINGYTPLQAQERLLLLSKTNPFLTSYLFSQ